VSGADVLRAPAPQNYLSFYKLLIVRASRGVLFLFAVPAPAAPLAPVENSMTFAPDKRKCENGKRKTNSITKENL
jgi:hypothetical protein